VLEIGAVVIAGRQHHHIGLAVAGGGGDAAQGLQQQIGIVIHRLDPVTGEQLREQAHHHGPVFQHVRDARRRAQIVFQHVEFVGAGAHHVHAGDLHIDLAGHVQAMHFGAIAVIAQHLLRRDDAGLQDVLVVIDVVDKGVQRLDPLDAAVMDAGPFLGGQHARNGVEGDQALGAFLIAIDIEGDADAAEQFVRLLMLARQQIGRHGQQPVLVCPVRCANRTVRTLHFVERHWSPSA
jgi:hypothetical protein